MFVFCDRVSLSLLDATGGQPLVCDSLAAALDLVKSHPTGRILVRGGNGSGKSTLLAAMKTKLGAQAYDWPTADSLAFAFDKPRLGEQPESRATGEEDDLSEAYEEQKSGFSSGERQLKSLQEISEHTHAVVYLLDEWDANLDAKNRSQAQSVVEKIAAKALVIEISHRDRV